MNDSQKSNKNLTLIPALLALASSVNTLPIQKREKKSKHESSRMHMGVQNPRKKNGSKSTH